MLHLRGDGRKVLPWIIAGLALYIVALLISFAINIPLNNELDKAGDAGQMHDVAAVRAHFEHKWVTWRNVRTAVDLAAFICLAWAPAVHGAQRGRSS